MLIITLYSKIIFDNNRFLIIFNVSFSCYFHPYFLSYVLHFVYSGSQIIRFIVFTDYEKRLRSVCLAIMNQHPPLTEVSYNYPVSRQQCIGQFIIFVIMLLLWIIEQPQLWVFNNFFLLQCIFIFSEEIIVSYLFFYCISFIYRLSDK